MMRLSKYLIVSLLFTICDLARAVDFNLGNWRLGMSKADVVKAYSAAPFHPVDLTGGIETRFDVFGVNSPVSFVFDRGELSYIQVFAYEGQEYTEAKGAALRILNFFRSEYGGASIHGIKVDGSTWLSEEAAPLLLDRVLSAAPEVSTKLKEEQSAVAVFSFDAWPKEQPENCKLHAKFVYAGRFDAFYVFLFQDLVDSPDRTSKTAIHVEQL